MGFIYEQVEFDQAKANENVKNNDWTNKIKTGKYEEETENKKEQN